MSEDVASPMGLRADAKAPVGYGKLPELRTDVLSPGDLLELTVIEGEMFSGSFVVEADGTIAIPHLPPVDAAGATPRDVERLIAASLVENEFFQPHAVNVDLALRQLGEVSVSVGGAVFTGGLISVGERSVKTRDDTYDNAAGTDNWRRKLSGVLKAAGGVRPDADVSRVVLRRGADTREYDMSGVFTGGAIDDPLVVAADYVFVPSRSCFSPDMVRPSRITPPGISVFVSNPTSPTFNSGQSGGEPTVSLPYGSRLSDALTASGCVGGARVANTGRYAMVVGKNPLNDEPEVMRVKVEDVIAQPHRPDLNPYLQAGDAIACFDGNLTNLRAIGDAVGSVLSPPTLLMRMLGL